jgi:microcystin-dependent protein
MASPYIQYAPLVILAASGAYNGSKQLDGLTAVFLLSACLVMRQRWLWQNPIAPIDDLEYQSIIEMIEEAEYQLMANMLIGSIVPFIAVKTDDSLLAMDGSTYAQADYSELFAILPSAWISGSNFTLPDMSDTFVIGADSDGNIGNSIGSNTHTLSIGEIPSHNHSYTLTTGIPTAAGLEPTFADLTSQAPSLTGNAGGGGSHNNIPQSLKMKYYIVAR